MTRQDKKLGLVNQLVKTFFLNPVQQCSHIYFLLTDYPFNSYTRGHDTVPEHLQRWEFLKAKRHFRNTCPSLSITVVCPQNEAVLTRVSENQFWLLTLIYVAVGLYDAHSFEWPFLIKFLWTKIVKQFVFLVQSNVFQHMSLNLWNNNSFISFYFLSTFF